MKFNSTTSGHFWIPLQERTHVHSPANYFIMKIYKVDLIMLGKDEVGWLNWALSTQITTTAAPRTMRTRTSRTTRVPRIVNSNYPVGNENNRSMHSNSRQLHTYNRPIFVISTESRFDSDFRPYFELEFFVRVETDILSNFSYF